MSAAAIHDPTHAYRRDARKLRGRFAHRPAELYRSLRQLSDHHDQIRSIEESATEPVSPTSDFAAEVRDFLKTGLLTYSARQKLINSAESRTIPRFEANLIIAAVQHRMPVRVTQLESPRRSRLPLILAVVLSQISVLITVWLLAAR